MRSRAKPEISLAHLPEQFIVFDLETTGLNPDKHEIIEIGAIPVNRDSTNHDTFKSLVKPARQVPKKITELTGINQAMLDSDGDSIESALRGFMSFVGRPSPVLNGPHDVGTPHLVGGEELAVGLPGCPIWRRVRFLGARPRRLRMSYTVLRPGIYFFS